MILIETKGDVKFFKNEKGKLYQQIGDGELFKVKDGNITYKTIKKVNGYTINYENNGVSGFSIFKGSSNLEDRIWTIAEAEQIAREL